MKLLQSLLLLGAVAAVLSARRIPLSKFKVNPKTNLELHPFFMRNPPTPYDQGDPVPSDVKFLLCTRANREGVWIHYSDGAVHPNYDGLKRTFAIVHGFGGGIDTLPWTHEMMNKILDRVDGNVILVDWGILSAQPWYYSASGNVHYVAQELGGLLKDLSIRTPLSPSNVHLIGFSLGGQVVGNTANHYGPEIDRITGLDPAGPDFDGEPENKRLDKSDAVFVDVIHTNSGWLMTGHLSVYDECGHVDFYPNGGQDQRGCKTLESEAFGTIFSSDDVEACSHGRSIKYFISSFTEDYFLGAECEDYEVYQVQEAECFTTYNKLGIDVDRSTEGVFYMETLPDAPFAARQNKVDFHMATHSSGSMSVKVKYPGMETVGEWELFGGWYSVDEGDVSTLILGAPGVGMSGMEIVLQYDDGFMDTDIFVFSKIEATELGTGTKSCVGKDVHVEEGKRGKVTLVPTDGPCF